jgi:hypothetical protein
MIPGNHWAGGKMDPNSCRVNAAGGPMSTVARLREFVRVTRDGEPLDRLLQTWMSDCIDMTLRRQYRTFDDAFGLRGPRGGVPWWLEEAIRRRDHALRELASGFLTDQPTSQQAHWIRLASVRYAASAWSHDRDVPEMPERYRDTPRQWLWTAFKSGAPMPLCERQLRFVVAQAGLRRVPGSEAEGPDKRGSAPPEPFARRA